MGWEAPLDDAVTVGLSASAYFALFATVVVVDQLSKQWAIRSLPFAGAVDPTVGSAWTRSAPRSLKLLGVRRAVLLWLSCGAAGAALCLAAGAGHAAALGGIAAWAAAASNLGEWRRDGGVVDWLRLWPRSTTNVADAVLIAGSLLFALAVAGA
jgi:lipoprotein signal peptidase